MDSRSNRYYAESDNDSIPSTRSNRNKKLYKEVYGKYKAKISDKLYEKLTTRR